MNRNLEFEKEEINKKINELEAEIKISKNYVKYLEHVYCLKSTIKENRQHEVAKMISFYRYTILNHQENILDEYKKMYKEIEKKMEDNE